MESEELGSILMRVIRILSESSSGEEREEQKKRLQVQFRETDHTLDQMVLRKQKELTKVLQIYASVSHRLHLARAKIAEIKCFLKGCQELLHYKRDDLKKHWLDGVEHKHILALMETIQELKDTPDKFDSLLKHSSHLAATRLLVRALEQLEGDLRNVDGLVTIRQQLDKRKEKLCQLLLSDLVHQLYVAYSTSSSSDLPGGGALQRLGSKQQQQQDKKTRTSWGGGGIMRKREAGQEDEWRKSIRLLCEDELALSAVIDSAGSSSAAAGDKISSAGHSAAQRIVVDVECLSLLDRLPIALDTLKSEQFNELQGIVRRTTLAFSEAASTGQSGRGRGHATSSSSSAAAARASPSSSSEDGMALLSGLFSAVVDQFTLVADLYLLLKRAANVSVDRNGKECAVRMEQGEIWAKVQTVVQLMLTDYLDFNSKTALHHQTPNAAQLSEPTSDLNSYFVRRKTARQKKFSLFRFDSSAAGLSLNDFYKDKYQENADEEVGREKDDRQLVCPPNPHNISPIYSSLMDFIGVIEKSMKYEPGNHCALYGFLMDYIKDVFLGQIHADNGNALNEASQSLDSWKAITDIEVLREYHVVKPLLQSVVGIKKCIDTMYGYMQALPLYCEHFLTMMCTTVMQYKEICLAAYRGLVQPESEDKRVISAQWAKDEAISGFLRSLPNWHGLKLGGAGAGDLETGDEAERRNARETELLKQNLGPAAIPDHEILCDMNQLKSLGLLHTSMQWFSANVLRLAQKFQQARDSPLSGAMMQNLSVNSIQTLTSLAKEFEDIADTCLLVLHLEVRLHCFYYLHPLRSGPSGAHFSGGQDSTDPNAEVVRLTSALLSVEESLSYSLDERRTRYIFEGVSHLVAALFIDSADNVRKMNKNGVKKMCRNIFAVQHTLTSNITGSREGAMDQAKQFYELVNLRPQDILNGLVEKGPMFTKRQYAQILQLLHRTDPNSTTDMLNRNLAKLDDIIKKVGVAV